MELLLKALFLLGILMLSGGGGLCLLIIIFAQGGNLTKDGELTLWRSGFVGLVGAIILYALSKISL